VGEWIVSVPVWGERYVKIFAEQAYPALLAAADRTMQSVRFLIHTDEESIGALRLVIDSDVFSSLPCGDQWWQRMSLAHRQALAAAKGDDFVMPLTADMVVSPEVFEACERRFAEGKRLVLCCGIRAIENGTMPDRSTSRGLLEWAWTHRHMLTTECMWPDGKSGNWTGIYFEKDGNVVFRPRYPHPIGVMPYKRRDRFFPTIDSSYSQNFSHAEVHVVTNPDELAAIELSPPEKALEFVGPSFSDRMRSGQLEVMNVMSGWIYDHRISIKGDPALVTDDAGIRPPQPCNRKHVWRRGRRFR